jgi:hypothetical protein
MKLDNIGQIEIKVNGKKGNHPLRPDNYDIREIIEVLQHAEHLLFPNAKKERPTISYEIEEGSVRHIIRTTLQAVIGFNAILGQIKNENYSIDFLESSTARAFEFFQQESQKNNYEYEIKTSISDETKIVINKDTQFVRSEEIWVEAELYFYGTIVDAGGKNKANVHLDTQDYGLLKIDAAKDLLANYENNPLYKPYGVRALGRQNVKSGEIDKSTLKLVSIIDYNPAYREDYIKSLINKAKKSWTDVKDADEWLENIRGYGV